MIWHSRGTDDPAHAWLRSLIRDVACVFAADDIDNATPRRTDLPTPLRRLTVVA